MSNGQPWWYAQCLANIEKLGPPFNVMCATEHCDSAIIGRYSELACSCQPPYQNGCYPTPTPNCCPFSATSPIPVLSLGCYCCCGCFATSTPVAYAKDQYKPIVEFEANVDMVYVADDVSLKSWSQRRVLWSAGAGGDDSAAANMMLKVTYGEGSAQDYLLVNRGQLFLLPDRTLKPASALVPGVDSVVKADGTPLAVVALEAGMFKKGLHHIATSTGAAHSPNGHLLLAKGIVCGDWALQVALSSEQHRAALPLAKELDHAPEFGTREYAAAHAHLEHKPFRSMVKGAKPAVAAAGEFEAFDSDDAAHLPETAFSLLTLEQSRQVHDKEDIAPPVSQAGKDSVRYLFKLFGAYYPQIKFYYDERSLLPNAYYIEQFGTASVVITGGLVRCRALRYEGLALVIATVVGAVTGGPPYNRSGQSCLGMAAYSAVGGVLGDIFFGLKAVPIIKGGMAQLQALFKNISAPSPVDNCMNISPACLLQSMQASFDLMPLPHCAGGPPDPELEVVGATVVAGKPNSVVTVTFNLPVDPVTGTAPANYAFDPLAETFSASLVQDNASAVAITVDLAAKTSYTVTAVGVMSQDQQPLVPGKASASFKT